MIPAEFVDSVAAPPIIRHHWGSGQSALDPALGGGRRRKRWLYLWSLWPRGTASAADIAHRAQKLRSPERIYDVGLAGGQRARVTGWLGGEAGRGGRSGPPPPSASRAVRRPAHVLGEVPKKQSNSREAKGMDCTAFQAKFRRMDRRFTDRQIHVFATGVADRIHPDLGGSPNGGGGGRTTSCTRTRTPRVGASFAGWEQNFVGWLFRCPDGGAHARRRLGTADTPGRGCSPPSRRGEVPAAGGQVHLRRKNPDDIVGGATGWGAGGNCLTSGGVGTSGKTSSSLGRRDGLPSIVHKQPDGRAAGCRMPDRPAPRRTAGAWLDRSGKPAVAVSGLLCGRVLRSGWQISPRPGDCPELRFLIVRRTTDRHRRRCGRHRGACGRCGVGFPADLSDHIADGADPVRRRAKVWWEVNPVAWSWAAAKKTTFVYVPGSEHKILKQQYHRATKAGRYRGRTTARAMGEGAENPDVVAQR